MISSSFLAYTTKLSKNPYQYSLFHYFLLSRSFTTQTQENPSFSIPTRLNHKDWLAPNEVLQVFETLKDPNSVPTALELFS